MILQLHDVYDPNKVSSVYVEISYRACSFEFLISDMLIVVYQINVRIKIVSGSPCGAVAAEAKKVQAKWVVLDK